MFSDMQKYIYIYSESLFNTLYLEIKHHFLKKIPSNKKKRYKKCTLSQVPTHHSSFENSIIFSLVGAPQKLTGRRTF